jgi:predicted nucleic acid-binding protein
VIAVDTNVLAYLLIPGIFTPQAEKAFRRDPEWAAPLLWRSEFRNVLMAYVRRGEMSVNQAGMLAATAENLMQGGEYTLPSDSILELAASSGCSAYDCEFVVLAETLEIPLVTSDQRILRAFPTLAVSLDSYVSGTS